MDARGARRLGNPAENAVDILAVIEAIARAHPAPERLMQRSAMMSQGKSEPRTLDVEQVDLADLRELLRTHEPELGGSLDGRSRMRDVVAEHLGCSMLEGENLVDTLIAQGFARLERDPEGREGWRLTPPG